MKKHPYFVSGSAPRLYPTEIIFAGLMWSNDDGSSDGISVPPNYFYPFAWGWGELSSPTSRDYDNDDQVFPVPTFIEMTWLSLVENKLYTIKENLPKEEIEQLLQETNEGKPLYDCFVVGMAPYGQVALWLHGDKRAKLIAWMEAEETEEEIECYCLGVNVTRDEYVYRKTVEDVWPEGGVIVTRDEYVYMRLKNSVVEALINHITNGLPPRDLYDRYMQQFTYRYVVQFGRWDEEKKEWRDYSKVDKPGLDYIEEVLFDGTHDKLHDGGLLNYHEAGKPERLALQFHIKKSEYAAYFWMDDMRTRAAFEDFYREHPGAGMDFVFRIDPGKNIYQIAFISDVAEETGILKEETYQFLVFKNRFECCRSKNYNFPRGKWEWWYGEDKRLDLCAFK